MFNQDNFSQNGAFESGGAYASGATTYDAGLRAHMIRVFNTVAAGLGLSGLVAFGVAKVPALMAIFMNPVVSMLVGIGLIAFLWFGFTPTRAMQQPLASLRVKYYAFTALLGATMAYVFVVYSGQALTRVFFITAAMFAGTSLIGYTTKRDLTGLGGFMMMGLIGIVLASLVNMFLKSTGMSFVISIISVLVFTGLIAFESQTAKRLYSAGNSDETNHKLAILSALGLYINFINLFQTLLRIFGGRQ